MKSNTKLYLFLVVLAAVCIWAMFSITNSDRKMFEREDARQKELQSHLGEYVVIDSDTTTIVQLNFSYNRYVLSNGKEVTFGYPSFKK